MLRILFVLLAFLCASSADAAVEIVFYSHDMTMRGEKIVDFPHAFITVRGTPDAGGRPIDSNYGFTAAKISPAILLGPVKGAMVKAGRRYIGKSRRHFALRLDDARFGAVQRAYKSWAAVRGLSYSLETRNCVHFVAEMARAAGLAVPADQSLMKKPREYLDALAARNPRVGL